MLVHVNQIDPTGTRLSGIEETDILEIGDSGVRTLENVEYDLEVGMSKGGLYATGTIGVNLEFTCVRCLEAFTRRVEVADFAMQTELTGSETVDLTPWLREDILLALPTHPHCDDRGERVCPAAERFQGNDPDREERPQGDSAWDILDQLNP